MDKKMHLGIPKLMALRVGNCKYCTNNNSSSSKNLSYNKRPG